MNKKLIEQDFIEAANILEINKAAIKAVCEVEAPKGGFLPDGRPTILFEAHIFSKKTGGKYNSTHPDISSPSWNRSLYKGGAAEYERLEKAKNLDLEAAYKSASWGKFQIMGFNYKHAGFSDVFSFVDAMWVSEGKQLKAFISFIKNNPNMAAALKQLNWAEFARAYNGPGYKKNNYDVKMMNAYKKYLGANENINS